MEKFMESYKRHLQVLLDKHKHLDDEIDNLENITKTDSVALHDLKKRKLLLKDEIGQIKNKIQG